MAGPVPAIHGFTGHEKAVDAWDKPRQDESIFPPVGMSPGISNGQGLLWPFWIQPGMVRMQGSQAAALA